MLFQNRLAIWKNQLTVIEKVGSCLTVLIFCLPFINCEFVHKYELFQKFELVKKCEWVQKFELVENSFRILIKSNLNQIVFTIFWLIWNRKRTSVWFQIHRKMVNIIWFRFDFIRFRKDFCVYVICITFAYIKNVIIFYSYVTQIPNTVTLFPFVC